MAKHVTAAQQVIGRRWGRWARRCLLALLAFVILVSCGMAFTVHRYGLYDGAAEADVIVILGAGLSWEDGQPTGAMIRRVQHGAALYGAGYASWMICSGGYTVPVPVSEAAVCADLLVEDDVPRDAILLEEHSRSTEENAIYTAGLMRERGWQTAIVTSDDFHLWRASLLFQAQGVSVVTSPAQVTSGSIPALEYMTAVGREVLALLWQRFKDTFGLPVTYVP